MLLIWRDSFPPFLSAPETPGLEVALGVAAAGRFANQGSGSQRTLDVKDCAAGHPSS